MGQKVHPYGFRLGYNKNWQSRWFSKKDYPAFVYEDHEVRKYVKKLLYSAGISKIEIERAGGKIRLILSTARPGIVIGRTKSAVLKWIPSWWPKTSLSSLNAASRSVAP